MEDEFAGSGIVFSNTPCQALFPSSGSALPGAFLQGGKQQANKNVVPVNELVDAPGITRGTPARLRKAG